MDVNENKSGISLLGAALVLAVSLSGCFDEAEYEPTEFYLLNKCEFEVDAHSTGKNIGSGPVNIHDKIKPQTIQYLRRIKVSSSFKISDVFTKILLFRAEIASTCPIMDKSNWESSFQNNVNTLVFTIDSTCFK